MDWYREKGDFIALPSIAGEEGGFQSAPVHRGRKAGQNEFSLGLVCIVATLTRMITSTATMSTVSTSSSSSFPIPKVMVSPPNPNLATRRAYTLQVRQRGRGFRCLCSASSGPSGGPGDSDSKAVLDAFFLGKAFAEALNERVGSAVGELLSVVGQWQAEQQKQVEDFQEEVLVRARRAKEKAAMEAMEAQGISPKSVSSPGSSSVEVVPTSTLRDNDQPTGTGLE